MKILITGGLGFIGMHLAENLAVDNWVVVCDKKQGKSIQEYDIDAFKPDIIYHLAATARVGVSLKDPAGVIQNNISGLLKVLEYCRQHPATKLIFASSSSVKFAKLDKNPYALSKAMGEQLVDMYRNLYDVRAVSVRFFNVYGPREADYGMNTTLVKQCKKNLLAKQPFYIEGDGEIIRDFTHVDDVVDGLIAVCNDMDERQALNLFELGSGIASITVRQVVEEFQKGTTLPIEWRASRIGDPPYTNANIYLSPKGWSPKIDILTYIQNWKADGCPDD